MKIILLRHVYRQIHFYKNLCFVLPLEYIDKSHRVSLEPFHFSWNVNCIVPISNAGIISVLKELPTIQVKARSGLMVFFKKIQQLFKTC